MGWIKEEMARLETAHHEGWHESPLMKTQSRRGNDLGVSIEDFIRSLLDARQRHRERRRKAALNRRAKAAARRPRKAPLPD